ncbi:glycine betaine ABC transporter substrate-binding protein [Sporosarcina sp. FSL K6-1522]|uniref:glycine betaine ABC transporter substrate-binding protein n=1 Tax=Sporosarcina sp. FSL K6-1522 TaxID=2921554 RepID=UPI00315A37F6
MMKKVVGLGAVALLAIGLAACDNRGEKEKNDTEKSVAESLDRQIIGIDPGANIMTTTEKAIEEYELKDFKLISGSGATMTAALKRAYDKEQPIVVIGWTPHWKFAEFDLKFLDDPKGLYGGAEQIRTIGRQGLADDLPEAHQILSRFNWTEEDMNEVMKAIYEGEKEQDAAQSWIDANSDKVAEWTDGVDKVDGDKIKLVYVAWDSEIASHNVMKLVLEDMGYQVNLMQVESGPMWTAVADGSADASLAAWLPLTAKAYADKFEGQFEELGVSVDGVKVGLVVPEYMDIDSIEDLKN